MRRILSPLLASALCLLAPSAPAQQSQLSVQQTEAPAQPSQPADTPLTQFQHLEDSWSIALVNKDQFGLDNLLAPTFINISAAAQVTTRNQYIADTLNSLPTPLLSVEQKVVSVRVFSDVAIVEGTYILRLRDGGEHVRDERGIFTHIYARSRDTWSCVNAQRTIVVDQVEGAKAASPAKPKKKSNADLPFHIPLTP